MLIFQKFHKKNLNYLQILLFVGMIHLTACGFQLRGDHASLLSKPPNVTLSLGSTAQDILIKNSLKQNLSQIEINAQEYTKDVSHFDQINISNVQLKSYALRGLLTEIRLVLQADVVYHIMENGQPKVIPQKVQVQHSYQYDQATVSTEDPQAEQIHHWLYDKLAQRITDQYVALSLVTVQSSQ